MHWGAGPQQHHLWHFDNNGWNIVEIVHVDDGEKMLLLAVIFPSPLLFPGIGVCNASIVFPWKFPQGRGSYLEIEKTGPF